MFCEIVPLTVPIGVSPEGNIIGLICEGDGINDELVISGDVGLEFNNKSKKGFQFDRKQNLFTDVRYEDLLEVEKIIDGLPQPKKEKKKKGFIEECLKVLAEQNPTSSYAVNMPDCVPRCVI